MKLKTNLAHPDFGCVSLRKYKDSEIQLRQINDRIFITPEQATELIVLLQEIVKGETK